MFIRNLILSNILFSFLFTIHYFISPCVTQVDEDDGPLTLSDAFHHDDTNVSETMAAIAGSVEGSGNAAFSVEVAEEFLLCARYGEAGGHVDVHEGGI